MLATSFALYVDSTKVVTPRSADGLRKPDAYPGLEEVSEFRKKRKGVFRGLLRVRIRVHLVSVGPLMWFPGPILRANRAEPDKVYSKSSHVVLSPTVRTYIPLLLTYR